MKIEIKNLGIIKSADVDLSNNLTVFTGPNNSGKTYLAYLIYAITKASYKPYDDSDFKLDFQNMIKNKSTIHRIDINRIKEYRKKHLSIINSDLDSLFGISNELSNNLFKDFYVNITETDDEFLKRVENLAITIKVSVGRNSYSIIKNENTLDISMVFEGDEFDSEELKYLDIIIHSKIYFYLAFSPFTNSYILPVERNSIYSFSKELSIQRQDFFDQAKDFVTSGSFNSSSTIERYFKRSTRYPLAIRDGLSIAEDLSNTSKKRSEFAGLAEEIESDLLFGTVNVNKDGEVQFTSNKAKRLKIPIQLSASIVKTLSSLVFYLKHKAEQNDLIIIDEPELNLHPSNQVFLTRIFSRLINKGFRMIINTHSDYVIRELNNLIMLSNKEIRTNRKFEELGYKEDEFVNSSEVTSYMFNFKNKSSKNISIKRIPINEFGFDVESIDNTIDELNNTTEELFYLIKYPIKNED